MGDLSHGFFLPYPEGARILQGKIPSKEYTGFFRRLDPGFFRDFFSRSLHFLRTIRNSALEIPRMKNKCLNTMT